MGVPEALRDALADVPGSADDDDLHDGSSRGTYLAGAAVPCSSGVDAASASSRRTRGITSRP